MNVLSDRIKTVYFRFLAASFGSTLISSIYGIVDMAMVGQYHGPEGSAALAVFAPVWNIIYSLGLLAGIGGSVLYGNLRGRSSEDSDPCNAYFTAAVLGGAILSAAAWLCISLFHKPMLVFFGADEALLALSQRYLQPVLYTIPSFVFNQLLAAFLRNDQDPGLATAAVLVGGLFNIFGDWFFVFFLDMGIYGAGLATSLGSLISTGLMLTHFVSRKNTLHLVKTDGLLEKQKEILISGFPTCLTDVSMGIMTILFNRQIMKYLGTDALAVYAIIINISTFVQCCAYCHGIFYTPDGMISNQSVRKDIANTLGDMGWCSRLDVPTNALFTSLKDMYHVDSLEVDETVIPLNNGDLYIGKDVWEFRLGEKKQAPYRLSVSYTPTIKPTPLFDKWLKDVFAEEDIPIVQEIMGYCLVPVTSAQEAFFLVGDAGVGKSGLGTILKSILGNAFESINTQELVSKRFQIATVENKLVAYDDDLGSAALEETGVLKKLITADTPNGTEYLENKHDFLRRMTQ